MIKIEVRGNEKVVKFLLSTGQRVTAEIQRAVYDITYDLQRYIQGSKLSGQVLNVKKGWLRGHVFSRVTLINENTIQGRVYLSTAMVPYAGIHEYGGSLNHPGGTAYLVIAGMGSRFIANANPIATTLPRTRAHQIALPARSYMRSGLSDKRIEIVRKMNEAVQRGLRP